MAFDDTKCPCGGKKLPETMLCRECETHLATDPDMIAFLGGYRREAAIRLLSRSRRRVRAGYLFPG